MVKTLQLRLRNLDNVSRTEAQENEVIRKDAIFQAELTKAIERLRREGRASQAAANDARARKNGTSYQKQLLTESMIKAKKSNAAAQNYYNLLVEKHTGSEANSLSSLAQRLNELKRNVMMASSDHANAKGDYDAYLAAVALAKTRYNNAVSDESMHKVFLKPVHGGHH